jgi:hypothetical protein
MDSDKLRPHLDVINRFYDQVMATESMTTHETAAVYRAIDIVQANSNAIDAPLRPALADILGRCEAKLARRPPSAYSPSPVARRPSPLKESETVDAH